MVPRLASYEEFWPYYVSEHSQPSDARAPLRRARRLVLVAFAAGVLVSPWWFLAAPFAGYGFAWVGHFFFEKNRPATFTYPLWSLRGDFRMFRLMLLGRMGPSWSARPPSTRAADALVSRPDAHRRDGRRHASALVAGRRVREGEAQPVLAGADAVLRHAQRDRRPLGREGRRGEAAPFQAAATVCGSARRGARACTSSVRSWADASGTSRHASGARAQRKCGVSLRFARADQPSRSSRSSAASSTTPSGWRSWRYSPERCL